MEMNEKTNEVSDTFIDDKDDLDMLEASVMILILIVVPTICYFVFKVIKLIFSIMENFNLLTLNPELPKTLNGIGMFFLLAAFMNVIIVSFCLLYTYFKNK